jgi:hypothetical protein
MEWRYLEHLLGSEAFRPEMPSPHDHIDLICVAECVMWGVLNRSSTEKKGRMAEI